MLIRRRTTRPAHPLAWMLAGAVMWWLIEQLVFVDWAGILYVLVCGD